MTTYNHTAIGTGAAANAATFNTPLGALDAAIGDLSTLTTTADSSAVAALNEIDALIGAAAASSGSIATSIDTDGTLKAGAVDVAAVLADGVVTAAKILNGAIPSPNLALDPFNRRYPLGGKDLMQDGRRRAYGTTTAATWVAESSAPGGYVIRIPTTETNGRKMWLDEMGLVVGDVVSFDVYAKVPTGRTVKLTITWRTAANGSISSATSSNAVGADAVVHMTINAQTIPATATNVDVYVTQVSGTGDVDVYSWGVFRGSQVFTAQIADSIVPVKREPANLAFDPQNELLNLDESPDERIRWYTAANLSRESAVVGTGLGTPIIRIDDTSTGGRRFWLDEMGLKVGDRISFGFVANVGVGRTFKVGYAWRTATAAISSASGSITHTGTGETMLYAVHDYTLVATTESIDIFPSSIGGTVANIDIYAWVIVKGDSLGDNVPIPSPVDGRMALNEGGKFPATMLGYGKGYLRDWFAQLAKIRGRDNSSQVVVGCFGDSWAHLDARLVAPLRDALQSNYGNGGPGYVSANSDVYLHTESQVVSRTVAGTWTNHDKASSPRGYGPDLNDAYTTDIATPASITWTTTTPCNAVDIHYLTADQGLGLQYQVDGGSWSSSVDTNAATAFGVVSITGLADTTHTVAVKAVTAVTGTGAGGLTVMGADFKRTGLNAVRVHKLGSNGSMASHWTSHPSSTVLLASLAQLGVNLATITLGTNDHGGDVLPSTFAASLDTLIATLRTGSNRDVLLLMPGDNGATETYKPHNYMSAMRAVAVRNSCAGFNSYLLLGDYTTANARGLYGDSTHINIEGGRVLAHGLINELLTPDLATTNAYPFFAKTEWKVSKDFGASIEDVSCMAVYDGKLFVGLGSGSGDGDIWSYDGALWTLYDDPGAGIDSVYSLCVYNGKLYAGVGIDSGDGDAYVFDGTTWALSNSFGVGFEAVYCLCVYNGKLYAGLGNGAGNGDIYSYDGSSWTSAYDPGAGIESVYSLCVYNGKLYAGVGSSAGDGDVYVFDGTTWAVANDFGAGVEGVYSLCVYDGKLYAGLGLSAGDGDIYVFDGSTWAVSKDFGASIEIVYSLCAYNGRLYAGIGSGAGDGDVWSFNGATWAQVTELGSGVERVNALCVYNGKLYAGTGASSGDGDLWVYSEPVLGQLAKEFSAATPLNEQPQAFTKAMSLLADVRVPLTITAPGTTGNRTINQLAGRVNIAAGGTSVVVTNSFVTANSIVLALPVTNDTTARITNIVPAAGSFTIRTVAVTAETAFSFLVINPA